MQPTLRLAGDDYTRSTAIGLFAPICWGMSVGLVRGIAEGFGMAQGQFLLYCIATTCLFFMVGLPDFRKMSKKYLFIGIPTANASSLSFCLALFTSAGGRQTLEVGMVNYLWPSLTIVAAVLFAGVKARWQLWPGLLVAIAGIMVVLGGEEGVSPALILQHASENPASYLLAVVAATTWAAFSIMTRRWGNGVNPSTLIFALDALLFGGLWLLGVGEGPSEASWRGIVSAVFGGFAMAGAYAAWTRGMARGNITVLAVASYFTPVLSCLFGAVWLGADLTAAFWTGVGFVVLGSLVCWHATREQKTPGAKAEGKTEGKTEGKGAVTKGDPKKV